MGLLEARDDEERAALVETGRLLFAKPCEFFFAAQRIDQLPPPGLPELGNLKLIFAVEPASVVNARFESLRK